MNKKTNSGLKIICLNRKASFNYFFEDILEAGIVLKGSEIKSIRESKIDISNAFCRIQNDEVWLHNAHISPYSNIDFQPDYNPTRSRKLLLNKREILKWDLEAKRKNLPIIKRGKMLAHIVSLMNTTAVVGSTGTTAARSLFT